MVADSGGDKVPSSKTTAAKAISVGRSGRIASEGLVLWPSGRHLKWIRPVTRIALASRAPTSGTDKMGIKELISQLVEGVVGCNALVGHPFNPRYFSTDDRPAVTTLISRLGGLSK